MIKLRIKEILEEKGHTMYWLYKRMGLGGYQNFKRIIDNETSSIRFELLEKFSYVLKVPVGDLFEQTEDMTDEMRDWIEIVNILDKKK